MTVNKEAVQLLVQALESGEFTQGKSYLEKDGDYCCLGVACVVAHRAGVIEELPWNLDTMDPNYADLVLPDNVREWFGFASVDPVLYRNDNNAVVRATTANDRAELTFTQIAGKFKESYLGDEVIVFKESYLGDEVIVDPNP